MTTTNGDDPFDTASVESTETPAELSTEAVVTVDGDLAKVSTETVATAMGDMDHSFAVIEGSAGDK